MTAPRRLWTGAAVQLGSVVSVNFGSAVAGLLIPVAGVLPVVAARQLVTAATLAPFWRPSREGLAWRRLWPAAVLGLALLAAGCWAAYILFTRRVALTLPGLEGITVASIVTTVLAVPVALVTIDWRAIGLREWMLLLALGVLSSAIPYSLDAVVLRRLTPRIYAVVTASGPAVAAVFGWLVLHEGFTLAMVLGIALVVCGSAVAILSHREPEPPTGA